MNWTRALDTWQSVAIHLGDAAWGWLLWLPRDLAVLGLGILLAGFLWILRRFLVNRERFALIAADERRLGELLREARLRGDRAAVRRHRRVKQIVAGQRLRVEWLWLSATVPLLSLVGFWGQARLPFLPLRANEEFEFVARFPGAAAGELTHLAPVSDVTAQNGWIRVIRASVQDRFAESARPQGEAVWALRSSASDQHQLIVRHRGGTCAHSLRMGEAAVEHRRQFHAGGVETEVRLAPYRPLGWLPAQFLPGLPGWALFLSMVTSVVYLAAQRFLANRPT